MVVFSISVLVWRIGKKVIWDQYMGFSGDTSEQGWWTLISYEVGPRFCDLSLASVFEL